MSLPAQKPLIIINPEAGRYKASDSAAILRRELERRGALVREIFTTGIGDAREIASREAGDHDLIIACGGDGTLSEVISGLMRLESPPDVGFLPVGSTCDIARTFQLSARPVQAAHEMVSGVAYAIDIGRIGGSNPLLRDDLPPGVVPDRPELLPDHFTYVSSFGAFTETSYATGRELKRSLGHFAYILKGLQSVARIHPQTCSVLLDGEDYSGEYIFGGVLNSFSVGGLVKLDQVYFDDGYYEVLLIEPPRNLGQTASLVSQLLRRRTGPAMTRKRAREIVFTFPQPVSFTVDGEYGGTRTEWTMTNIPRAIRLRVPRAPGTRAP